MAAAAPSFIKLTRRGFLATQLLHSNPNAEWADLEDVVERIAARGETHTHAELELMLLCNLTEFPEKLFPDGGRSS